MITPVTLKSSHRGENNQGTAQKVRRNFNPLFSFFQNKLSKRSPEPDAENHGPLYGRGGITAGIEARIVDSIDINASPCNEKER